MRVIKKKSIVFILSDFIDSDYENSIQLVSKKHDLTGIRIYDKIESIIPNLGIVPFRDNETSVINYVNTNSKSFKSNHAINYYKKVNYFEESFKKNGSGQISCQTDEDFVKKLLSYFKRRI